MKISCKGIVSYVGKSKKEGNDNHYLTVTDLENGGAFSFGMQGQPVGVGIGSLVQIEGNFSGFRGQYGYQLKAMEGQISFKKGVPDNGNASSA